MKRKKLISSIIILLFVIWFFQYYLSYVPGAYTIGVFVIGIALWITLFAIAIYQLIKYIIEEPKHKGRILYLTIILALNFVTFTKPVGIVDWEKFEEENILVAEMIGTVNCRTILKLRKDRKFKYVSSCFGKDFYFGTYKLSNDTLHFELDQNVGFMDKSTYATLYRSKMDSAKYHQLLLRQNYKDKRNISMLIKEIKMNDLITKNEPRDNK